ncbi:BglG family transcription antiterminator [Alkalibacterium sp. AK22]|uniref:BglG family transcription antiterminator n=1 Tax=Alkalibacterium sp. AK22 TaxID=1229520 RepID=UPI0005543F9F|nr:BglG family transcription antiterminator [Alkalibacterium sp. AK22]
MQLSERSQKILMQLLSDDAKKSYDELADEFSVSERAIRYDLEEIDAFLISKNLPPLARQTKVEVFLESEDSKLDKLKELTSELDKSFDYYLPKKRQHLIFIEILLSQDIVDIHTLMNRCEVSRSSIVGDIRQLRKLLKDEDITIEYTSAQGYYFSGDEKHIRKTGMKIISLNARDLNLSDQKLAEEYLDDTDHTFVSVLEQFVSGVEADVNKAYSDISFNYILKGLIIAVSRVKSGCLLASYLNGKALSPEYKSIDDHVHLLEEECRVEFSQAEKKALEQLFLESSLIKAESIIDDNWIDLNLFIIAFLNELSRILNLPLNQSEDLFDALVLHLGPAINRAKNESPLKNEIIDYIRTQYEEVFEIVKKVLNDLGSTQGLVFTADEIGFVTIHIASYIEKEALTNKNKTILLVCNYGVGTAKLLETMLLKYFDFDIKGTLSVRELNQSWIDAEEVDYIVSTLPIREMYSVPILVVSPLLTEKDKQNLTAIEEAEQTKSTITMSIERSAKPIMLKDLLVEETIQLGVHAEDWKDAVKLGGGLLEEAGKIEDTYTKAMVSSVEELGPYIVIAPGIAMPHASSKDGVHEVGLSLMTLREPVNFGHPDNDPVDIVICLAATDHTSHLNALKDLMGFLNDKTFIDLLKTGNKDDILSEINRKESV